MDLFHAQRRHGRHAEAWALHADLLRLRREDPVIAGRGRAGYDGGVLDDHAFVVRFLPHLDEACVGSVSEIFDAEDPFAARGCVAQAWSVAEMLRAWIRTE